MATLSVLENRTKSNVKLAKNSKLFKTIISAIQDKKGEQIVSLDLRKVPEAVADFFVICQASSTTQVKAIADYVEHQVKEICNESPYKNEGKSTAQWVLVDYINIVIHVMHPDARKFYKIEDMWNDAPIQAHDL
ncbi:MAG: ribosome silencing factor [Chitinophagaceae bacterium]